MLQQLVKIANDRIIFQARREEKDQAIVLLRMFYDDITQDVMRGVVSQFYIL